MAKVILPLLSVEARNKIGNAMVFFPLPHSDQNVVRRWLKPSNPKSEGQGDVRLYQTAAGKVLSKIVTGGTFQIQVAALTPAGEIWNARLVKTIHGTAFADIIASLTAWDTAANSGQWTSVASSLGIADQDVSYASIAPITKGEVLFLAGRAGYDLGIALCPADAQSLTDAQIQALGNGFLT